MATVFAQLWVGGTHYGVHAFLVPLRDEATHRIRPGVRIKDCGHKMGLNGIDNGRFWFDHVRIPRTHLLDRYGHVTRTGEYESIIPDNDMRFAASLGTAGTRGSSRKARTQGGGSVRIHAHKA
jgi:acyl-CoA oxidase